VDADTSGGKINSDEMKNKKASPAIGFMNPLDVYVWAYQRDKRCPR
jgi:hypothetical protein